MFHVGQKVVYVGSPEPPRPRHPDDPTPRLVKGEVYTIRDIDRRIVGTRNHPDATILLFERVAPKRDYAVVRDWEIGYKPHVFRPLIERKTDISIFTKMLKPRELALTAGDRQP